MDTTEIEDMFAGLGPVSIRRMFGGKGVYHQGLIVAVDLHGDILLKADDLSAPAFEAAGATRWTYESRSGDEEPARTVSMPYWSIPEGAFDDPDEMTRWVRLAYEAALRSAAAKARKPPRRRPA